MRVVPHGIHHAIHTLGYSTVMTGFINTYAEPGAQQQNTFLTRQW